MLLPPAQSVLRVDCPFPRLSHRLHPNQNPRPDASPAVPVPSQEAASSPHQSAQSPARRFISSLPSHTHPQHTRDSTRVRGRAGENASWDWQHLGIISAPLVQTIGR